MEQPSGCMVCLQGLSITRIDGTLEVSSRIRLGAYIALFWFSACGLIGFSLAKQRLYVSLLIFPHIKFLQLLVVLKHAHPANVLQSLNFYKHLYGIIESTVARKDENDNNAGSIMYTFYVLNIDRQYAG